MLKQKVGNCFYKEQNLLNKRNKIVSKCRHELKYARARYDTEDKIDVRLIEPTMQLYYNFPVSICKSSVCKFQRYIYIYIYIYIYYINYTYNIYILYLMYIYYIKYIIILLYIFYIYYICNIYMIYYIIYYIYIYIYIIGLVSPIYSFLGQWFMTVAIFR